MIVIAQQGGYLNRKRDRHPGFECLWRGYALFAAMVQILRLHHAAAANPHRAKRCHNYVGQAQA